MMSEDNVRMSHLHVLCTENRCSQTPKTKALSWQDRPLSKEEKTGARKERSSLRSDARQKKGGGKPTVAVAG